MRLLRVLRDFAIVYVWCGLRRFTLYFALRETQLVSLFSILSGKLSG